jgi:hypothetical protein
MDRSPVPNEGTVGVSRTSRAFIGGKLLMPAELQAIHRYVVETPVLETVTDEIRAAVKTVWPELISKLPPKL